MGRVTVNVNNLSLCHRGSGGISRATLPDVCKTPGNAVPLPYPNVAFSRDLVQGTTSITADGGHMCAKYGSRFATSIGDAPGSLGGVKSGTVLHEASWITYSFDVTLEGQGACRLTDKMWHNKANTVNAAGLLQAVLPQLRLMLCDCDKEIAPGPDDTCATLGQKKHKCMEDKKKEHNRRGGQPRLDGEKGYNYKTGRKIDIDRATNARNVRKYRQARAALDGSREALRTARTVKEAADKVPWWVRITPKGIAATILKEGLSMAAEAAIGAAIDHFAAKAAELGKLINGNIFPDGAVRDAAGRIDTILEYKFSCPKGVPIGNGYDSNGGSVTGWGPGQEQRTKDLIRNMQRNSPGEISPDATAKLLSSARECAGVPGVPAV